MRAKVWFSGKTFLRQRSPYSCASKRCTLDLSINPAARFYGSRERAKTFLEMLATMLQTPESFSWDLQQCCKRQKVFRETCNSVANAKKFFGALAALLQTFPKILWQLERSIKDMLQGQQTSFFRRTRVAYRMGAVVRQEYPTCPKVFLSKKGRRLVRAS